MTMTEYKINEELLEKVALKMIKELKAKSRKRKRYYECKKFFKDFAKIKKWIIKNGQIDSENMLYFPEKYNFTERVFVELINTICEFAEKKWQDEDNGFPHERFEYDGVQFLICCGQGTVYVAWEE